MQAIQLRVSDKVYGNLLWLLSRFGKDEIQVIKENNQFLSIQEYLKIELEQVEHGNGEFVSFEELERHLEETLQKYEENPFK